MNQWQDTGRKTMMARIYCGKCNAVKVIEGYSNPYWLATNVGQKQTQCDAPKCRSFITIKISKEGVEVL